jgi:hypothetical protein
MRVDRIERDCFKFLMAVLVSLRGLVDKLKISLAS